MRHIFIRTFAYNAEATLARAVDSILNQTYTNFTYYLLDNGSSDSTRALVQAYAAQDRRVVPFYTDHNMEFDKRHAAFLNLPVEMPDEDLFCVLDSDDAYDPDFLEKAVNFLDQNELDIVCCGSRYLDAKTGAQIKSRSLPQPLILENSAFFNLFPLYHTFIRTVWGKVIKGRCMRDFVTKRDPEDNSFPDYGIDTWDILSALRLSKRMGILPGTSHRYFVSPHSGSYRLSKKRIISDQLLQDATIKYLRSFEELTYRNRDFLNAIYLNALSDTLAVLINSGQTLSQTLDDLTQIFFNPHTKRLAAAESLGETLGLAEELQKQRRELFQSVATWMLSVEEITDDQAEAFLNSAEFACAVAEDSQGWLAVKKLRAQFLAAQGKIAAAKKLCLEIDSLLPDGQRLNL